MNAHLRCLAVVAFFVTRIQTQTLLPVNIVGEGATFPAFVYQGWASVYPLAGASRGRNVTMSFNAASLQNSSIGTYGSGYGVKFIKWNLGTYGASDSGIGATDLNPANGATPAGDSHLRAVPMVAGPIVVAYNVGPLSSSSTFNTQCGGGVCALNFTRDILCAIFNGTITTWNDASILAVNPTMNINSASFSSSITIVTRSGSSGTTQIFTDALTAFNPSWNGGSVASSGFSAFSAWSFAGAKANLASGNNGLAVKVLTTSFSIGYLELYYASLYSVSYGKIYNKAGNLVTAASASSVSSALTDAHSTYATVYAATPNYFYAKIVDGDGAYTYPIVGFSYIIYKTNWPSDYYSQYEFFRYLHWALTDTQATVVATTYNMIALSTSSEISSVVYSILSEVQSNITNSSSSTGYNSLILQCQLDYAAEVAFRNRITCDSCVHGNCSAVNTCTCYGVWKGAACNTLDVFVTDFQAVSGVAAVAGLNLLFALLTLMSFGALIWLSKTRIVRTNGFEISAAQLFFILVGHAGLFTLQVAPSNMICQARVFLLPISFLGVFGVILLKIWKLFYLFGASKVKSGNLSALTSPLRMCLYLLALVSVGILFSMLWVLIDSPVPVVLNNVDELYFYSSCSSSSSIIPAVFIALLAIFFSALIGLAYFVSDSITSIPKRYKPIENIKENIYFFAIMLVVLVINYAVNYSEYYKTIVYSILIIVLLQGLNGSLFGLMYYRALTAVGTDGKLLGEKESSSDVTSSRIASDAVSGAGAKSGTYSSANASTNPGGNEPKVPKGKAMAALLTSKCSRLQSGVMAHWEDETISYDPKGRFMIFDSTYEPGKFTTFSVPSVHTNIKLAPNFAENTQVIEFILSRGTTTHTVVLPHKQQSETGVRWVPWLKKAAELSDKIGNAKK